MWYVYYLIKRGTTIPDAENNIVSNNKSSVKGDMIKQFGTYFFRLQLLDVSVTESVFLDL